MLFFSELIRRKNTDRPNISLCKGVQIKDSVQFLDLKHFDSSDTAEGRSGRNKPRLLFQNEVAMRRYQNSKNKTYRMIQDQHFNENTDEDHSYTHRLIHSYSKK